MGTSSESFEKQGFDKIQALVKSFDNDRLAHALLFVDQHDPSFRTEVGRFIKNLFCTERQNKSSSQSCGYCDSCLVLSEPTPSQDEFHSRYESREQSAIEEDSRGPMWMHPDFVWLAPESQKGYSVDQIRALQSRFALKPSLSDIRIAWIEDAEKLSASGGAAANALLKLLEEPRPSTYLILSTSQSGSVLPTLQSRCQKYIFWNVQDVELEKRKDLTSVAGLNGWKSLNDWFLLGAPASRMPYNLPADSEGFWKDRDSAVTELSQVMELLWGTYTKNLSRWGREESLRALDVVWELDDLIRVIKHYGQPQLQWMNFREAARLGFVKDANN